MGRDVIKFKKCGSNDFMSGIFIFNIYVTREDIKAGSRITIQKLAQMHNVPLTSVHVHLKVKSGFFTLIRDVKASV